MTYFRMPTHITTKACQRAIHILRHQKISYVTKRAYCQVLKAVDPIAPPSSNDFPEKIHWTAQQDLWVYDCLSFSHQLIKSIKRDEQLIRQLNSKDITNRLDYADIIRVPGSKNYIEKFHYVHQLSPEDKYRVQSAEMRIKKYRGTYKLKPNMSSTAPVYLVPNSKELWKNKLIFIADLIKRLKIWSE